MKFNFVGGIFTPAQEKFILASSSGVIQNAANAFQMNLLRGFDELCDEVEVFNLPFVGAYPAKFRELIFPAAQDVIYNKTRVTGIAFLNLLLVKHFARFLALYRTLARRSWNPGDCFVIYSVHMPFIAAVCLLKRKFPDIRICLVVPDLPEYMSDNTGILYRTFKELERRLLVRLRKKIDCFVLLTRAMAPELGVAPGKFVVVEGIVSDRPQQRAVLDFEQTGKISFFYSGTLAGRYGIRDLVDAFCAIERQDIELWICGDGDAAGYVTDAAARDQRVKFFGQLQRAKVLAMQEAATVLINPRGPEGEFTKYSFPSKLLEYMSAGRPVVIHKLEGVPEEYYDLCFCTDQPGAAGLKKCMEDVIRMDIGQLSSAGARAREFALKNKSSMLQVRKIIDLVSGGVNV